MADGAAAAAIMTNRKGRSRLPRDSMAKAQAARRGLQVQEQNATAILDLSGRLVPLPSPPTRIFTFAALEWKFAYDARICIPLVCFFFFFTTLTDAHPIRRMGTHQDPCCSTCTKGRLIIRLHVSLVAAAGRVGVKKHL
jgi:hypothetical protein